MHLVVCLLLRNVVLCASERQLPVFDSKNFLFFGNFVTNHKQLVLLGFAGVSMDQADEGLILTLGVDMGPLWVSLYATEGDDEAVTALGGNTGAEDTPWWFLSLGAR